MAKVSGGVRKLKSGSKEYTKREVELKEMMDSEKYSSVEMSNKGGGYVAIEKSPVKHKIEEIEAARHLANNGYKVILKDEVGQMKTPDGYIFKASFEQRTPEGSSIRNIRYSLEHSKIKSAEVSVIYMKYNTHTKQSVVNGIKQYEEYNKYRFKQIIIVTPDGRVHKHRHNQ